MDDFRDRKILLVDDDSDVLNMMKTCLTKKEFTDILTAKSGEEAIKFCCEE